MTSLRPPGLGPIVGHTTENTCRIWIRAGDPADDRANLDADRRTVGVVGLVKGKRIDAAWYFRLNREYDRTGSFLLGSDVQLGYFADDFVSEGEEVPDELSKGLRAATLEPDQEYEVRAGTLTIDDPNPNAARVTDRQLVKLLPKLDDIRKELLELDPEKSRAIFRTFPAPGVAADAMAFLLGSCRYPGLLWKIKEADRIFGPMHDHFDEEKAKTFGGRARFTMMSGDQIYADELNRFVPLLRADTYAEFQDRYVSAFSAPNLRKLLGNSSTYMILDDHEIEDNWTQDRVDNGKDKLFNIAISAYMSYQWSHGPRTWGRLLYYKFNCAGYPFFVLDTRTQRFKHDKSPLADKGLRDNHMLGPISIDPMHPGQLKRMLDWLSEQQRTRGDVPKFIVSSSVFVPNDMSERIDDPSKTGYDDMLFEVNKHNRDASDSWPAFPLTRRDVLERIVNENIQNVVFLSGDIHCSNVAEMSFERGEGAGKTTLPLKAFSVTSSAFYWPFPFANGNPNHYVHDSREAERQWDPFPILDGQVRMHYKSSGFTQEDNFVRIDLDKAKATLTARVYDRDGDPVQVSENDDPKTRPLVSVLPLAPWG
jgi:alkaline phosphatase D